MNEPAWRSLLILPANNERFVARARESGADGVVLDLEDGVACADKPAARVALSSAIELLSTAHLDVVVRVNHSLRLAVRDVEAAVMPGVSAVMLPKTLGAEHVVLVDELVSELEADRGIAPGSVAILPTIETPEATEKAWEIAVSSPRVAALGFGPEDFAASMGAEPTEDVLLGPRQRVVSAARRNGLAALGLMGSSADFATVRADAADLMALAVRSRKFGFTGTICIQPDHVESLNTGFLATDEEAVAAQRIVEEYERATLAGRGAIKLDGRMIDEPIVERSRSLLKRRARYLGRP